MIKQLMFWTLVSFMGLCIFSVVFNQSSATAVGFPKVFYGGNTYNSWSGNGSVLSIVIQNLIIDLLVALGIGLLMTVATVIIQKKRQ